LDDNLREIQKVVRQDLATKGADIASNSTTDLGAVAGLMHDITGTTTITSFGTVAAGIWKIIKFEGALTLTHNASSLILPGGANITTADGDVAIVMSEGSGNWRCLSYMSANWIPSGLSDPGADRIVFWDDSEGVVDWLQVSNGLSVTGTTLKGFVLQQVRASDSDVATGTTQIPGDNSIPLNNEGDEYLTLAITPTSETSVLIIEAIVILASSASGMLTAALFQDTTQNALAASGMSQDGGQTVTLVLKHYMASGTTSETTFKIRAGLNGVGTTTFNGTGGARLYGGVAASSLIITEYSS
jgi:hypothetical protein